MRTALTRATEEMNGKHPGSFKVDEARRIIEVKLPHYETILMFKPYTDKEAIKKKLREAVKVNDKRVAIEHQKNQHKLF